METSQRHIALSLIIPLYNRREEIAELLDSLLLQADLNFEVVVVEDGSDIHSEDLVTGYAERLNVHYVYKENGGPGPARNFGAQHATGNYLVFLDSDCLIPEHYIARVKKSLLQDYTDAYGGPDRAHPSFTSVQKSINFAMTSVLSTGGIRGNTRSMEKFHPRSFNMGIDAAVFRELGGFAAMRFGEDVDFSMRIMEAGYTTRLIPDAFVYHKRRTDFKKFFKQVHNSGIARINLAKRHPGSLKPVHALPSVFITGALATIVLGIFWHPVFLVPLLGFTGLVFAEAMRRERSLPVAFLSVIAVFTQLAGYGTGFIIGFWRRNILGHDEFQAFEQSFYK